MNKKIVLVSGYGWSGSGLLIDILKQDDGLFYHFPVEIRFIKDKNGIIDLFSSNNMFNYSLTLKKFKKLCIILARNNFINYGMNYDKFSNYNFSSSVNLFLQNITLRQYFSDAFVFNYSNNFFQNLYWKILRKLNSNLTFKKLYIPSSKNIFKIEIQKFINNFTNSLTKKEYVIYDQAIDPFQWNDYKWIFKNSKHIVVDRDPRDIYVDYLKSKDVKYDVDSFIESFKYSRNHRRIDSSDIIYLKFENLILNHKQELLKVSKFLNIKNPKKLFNYDFSYSKKNIGIYKNYKFQDEIDKIYLSLEEYCFEK